MNQVETGVTIDVAQGEARWMATSRIVAVRAKGAIGLEKNHTDLNVVVAAVSQIDDAISVEILRSPQRCQPSHPL